MKTKYSANKLINTLFCTFVLDYFKMWDRRWFYYVLAKLMNFCQLEAMDQGVDN